VLKEEERGGVGWAGLWRAGIQVGKRPSGGKGKEEGGTGGVGQPGDFGPGV
jgi:hypothetical protein